MEKGKKIVSISTIAAIIIASLLLILLLFDLKIFGDSNGDVILTMVCLAIGGFFTINSLNMIDRNKIIGWVSFGLIVASVFLIILSTWVNLENLIVNKLTIVLGLLSVLFNVIVSSGLELGKTKLLVQILVYSIVGITCLFFSLILFEIVSLSESLMWFVIMIILSIVGIVILKVFAKKNVNDIIKQDKNMIKITREEYQILVDKAAKYDELISKSHQENQ